MNDQQLLRYSRHILLDDIGIEGQQRLLDAHALIIGAGGLGSPAALYLASAGIGNITLVDDDDVDLTNLQRQIMHATSRVGQPKATSGKTALAQLNPDIEVIALIEQALKGAPRGTMTPPPPIKLRDGPATIEWIEAAINDGRE